MKVGIGFAGQSAKMERRLAGRSSSSEEVEMRNDSAPKEEPGSFAARLGPGTRHWCVDKYIERRFP